MIGDAKIGKQFAGENDVSMALAHILNRLVEKADREWEVEIRPDAGADQKSVFIGTRQNVKLLLQGDFFSAINGETMRFRVCVAGVARDVDISGAELVAL